MDYKEKYENALERAKKFKEHLLEINDEGYTNEIDCMFPELAESEDEKIRKELISLFQDCIDIKNHPYNADDSRRWIAWLEKREEQRKTKIDLIMWKPVSEYTGGRVLATNDVDILVGYINSDGDCESEDCEGTLLCGITGFVEIEDVLPPKQGEQNSAYSYCQENCKGFQETGKCFADGECKAKRDAESIPYKCGDICTDGRFEIINAAKQELLRNTNIATSQKEMEVLDNFLFRCWQMGWLNKLKPQPHWKPTEEQLMALRDAIDNNEMESLYNDLKKL